MDPDIVRTRFNTLVLLPYYITVRTKLKQAKEPKSQLKRKNWHLMSRVAGNEDYKTQCHVNPDLSTSQEHMQCLLSD